MSGETRTFELTPELLRNIMSLMKGIQKDKCLLQNATKKKKHLKEEKNPTMEIFHEVFKKIGLSDVIVSKVLEETLGQALEIKSLVEELHAVE